MTLPGSCYLDELLRHQQKDYLMIDPYATGAPDIWDSTLGWPIPSAYPLEKFPPVTGYTGKQGLRPTKQDIINWRHTHADSNLLIRLHPSVVGIDVDDYGEKTGARTIERAAERHGPLPATYYSTARGPGFSGIHFYHLHGINERQFKGDLGPDSHVEVIRYSHRYAVVAPSWHPGAEARYKWYRIVQEVEAPPSVDQLPDLPEQWAKHLMQRCGCFLEKRKAQQAQMQRYKGRPSGTQGNALARMDFDKNVEVLMHMPMGGRNNYLSQVAGRTMLFDVLMNQALPLEDVTFQLMAAASESGLDETEAKNTLKSAWEWAHNIYSEGETTNG